MIDLLMEHWIASLRSGEISGQEQANILRFMKDYNIEVFVESNDKLEELAAMLPQFGVVQGGK